MPPISCDIYYVAISEEKLSELEDALAELAEDAGEVSAVLSRFEGGQPVDLAAVDTQLDALTEGANIASIAAKSSPSETGAPAVQDEWESENTEVEIVDVADDFVLLVDEDDLEELENASDDAPRVTVPPPLPGENRAQDDDADGDEEDEGFFKKLFGSRRNSNRP